MNRIQMAGKMNFVLGIDLGTSYFKIGLFNPAGELCGLDRVFVPKDTDGVNCELPIDRFQALLKQGVANACRDANAQPDNIQAIAYASQANSFLLLDKQSQPLTPLILWSDLRAQNLVNVANLFQPENFLARTGLGIDCSPEFCVAKLQWFQQQQPDLWARTARLMTLSDYFTFSLTNQYVGDAGTASLLGLLNLHTFEWLTEIVNLSGIQLAKPLFPGTLAGKVTRSGAELLGVAAKIPVVVGSLDHHLAAIGAGVGYFAEMSESTGTVLACLKCTTAFQPRPNICTGAGLAPGQFYQLAFDGNGAAALEWYQQNYAPERSIPELEQLATTVPVGSAGLVARPNAHRFPALSGFFNQTPRHHHGHFTRAIFESTAASLVRLVRQLSGSRPPKRIVATGGGAKSDLWLQIKANLLGTEFLAAGTEEPACQGAAMLAALAAGWFPNLATVTHHWVKIRKVFPPQAEPHPNDLE
jgi:sugar (pentulose or hexulose) kinase